MEPSLAAAEDGRKSGGVELFLVLSGPWGGMAGEWDGERRKHQSKEKKSKSHGLPNEGSGLDTGGDNRICITISVHDSGTASDELRGVQRAGSRRDYAATDWLFTLLPSHISRPHYSPIQLRRLAQPH